MNKEVDDALCMLVHCALKNGKFDTQKEQANIIRKHIKKIEQALNEIKEKLLCYGETFDSEIHQQFQRECLEIIDKALGDDSNES